VDLQRRRFLGMALRTGIFASFSPTAQAGIYPSRPIRIVVGFAPGGGSDILARLMARWLSERFGQSVIVENRPGAATNTATEAVVRAVPDGHTLLMFSTSTFINATLDDRPRFDFIRDIVPVASLTRGPLVMLVNPSFPADTVTAFVNHATAHPGTIAMASAGTGGTNHVAGELFQTMAGVKLLHVPYLGDTPALVALLGGQVQVYFGTLFGAIQYIRAGQLRALAVTATKRADALPEVPAMDEFIPGYEATAWNGLGSPRGTPAEIVELLNHEVNAGLDDPVVEARLADIGVEGQARSQAELKGLVAEEVEKWGRAIRLTGIRVR
jgi:tripartite-type tricarboxylate transporter receptor subunit TctC